MDRYHFQFKSCYQGESDYIVYDRQENQEFRIHYRTALNDYLERFFNGSKEQYVKEVIGSLYIVHRTCVKVDNGLVSAFRSYLQEQWDNYLIHAKKRIEQFPDYESIYTAGPASPIVYGGYYDNGWHRN